MTTQELLVQAKSARVALATLSAEAKNAALLAMADALVAHTEDILAANQADLQASQGVFSDVMMDRLALNAARIADMAEGIRQVAQLPDPVGRVLRTVERPNGLGIERRSVPMGVVAVYGDAAADVDMAVNIIENAKASRPSVCNAEEVCLVHRAIAPTFLPRLQARLTEQRAAQGKPPVELRLDRDAALLIPGTPAGERDFDTEFLDYVLAVRLVDSVDEAMAHIALHSTGHSDAIVTGDAETAEKFVAGVDSAAVYVNASTRFTDGGEFGLGCEMGISTQKLHARGPMGLEELCSYKYVIHGTGQIR